jgi:hypothetical protein
MTEKKPLHVDDGLAIDFLLGQCQGEQGRCVQARLAEDKDFARRTQKVARLLKMLDALEAPDPSQELIASTLAAVQSAARTQRLLDREAARFRPASRSTFTLKELGALAALLFVAVAILLPSARHAGQLARDQACQAQTGQVGTAMTNYANEHGGELPAMKAEQAAWLTGAPAPVRISNSRNLWQLVRGEYAVWRVFQCPAVGGGRLEELANVSAMFDFPGRDYIAYSYQNAVNCRPMRLSGESIRSAASAMAILADSTPVFVDGRFDPSRLTCDNSANHDRRGQAVLYLDMHTAWTQSANVGVGQDNIWLVQGVYVYQGTERPANETDSFLLPSCVEEKP